MDTLYVLAAGGMRARIDALDLLANNIANAGTPGFKADREFYDTYMSDGADTTVPDVRRQWTDFSQGTLSSTGNPLDLAISGQGFFSVQKTDGSVLLTRDGSFRVNAAGDLETAAGYKVRDDQGKPIHLDPAAPVAIAPDGSVTQSGRNVARLGVVDVGDTSGLDKQGHGYFRLNNVAALMRASGAEIQQGKLEMANCAPAEAAVRLVSVMRQFEMLQRAATVGADMNRKAVEDVARVGS